MDPFSTPPPGARMRNRLQNIVGQYMAGDERQKTPTPNQGQPDDSWMDEILNTGPVPPPTPEIVSRLLAYEMYATNRANSTS